MSHDPDRRVLFLLSSARPEGNALMLARQASSGLDCVCDWLDLAALDLPRFCDPRPGLPGPLDPVLEWVIARMQPATDLCLVAPVYWYALPAPAKLLLDHWSGLLDHPDLGFAGWMAAKRMWLITTRADPDPSVAALPEAMVERTARWLGMVWAGALHGVADAPGEVERDPNWSRAPHFLHLPPRATS